MNQASITEKYCINKDKPEMMCNGKCHLKKILNIDHSSNQSPKFSVVNLLEIDFFKQELIIFIEQRELVFSSVVPIFSQRQYAFLFSKDIDQPPQV